MKKLATKQASDYAYIETFIHFLDMLVGIIEKMWNNFIGSLGNLGNLLGGEQATDAANPEA